MFNDSLTWCRYSQVAARHSQFINSKKFPMWLDTTPHFKTCKKIFLTLDLNAHFEWEFSTLICRFKYKRSKRMRNHNTAVKHCCGSGRIKNFGQVKSGKNSILCGYFIFNSGRHTFPTFSDVGNSLCSFYVIVLFRPNLLSDPALSDSGTGKNHTRCNPKYRSSRCYLSLPRR